MMTLFLHLLELAIAITPVLAALLVLLPGPGRRYCAGARCAVWMVVALRLLVPFNISAGNAPFRLDLGGEIPGGLPSAQQAADEETQAAAELLVDALMTADLPASSVLAEPHAVNPADLLVVTRAEQAGPGLARVLLGIWLAGAAGSGLYLLATHLHAVRGLRRWSVPEHDEAVLALLESIKAERGIGREVCLYRSGRVRVPMLVGLLRPRILLPESDPAGEGARGLALVLDHELCHLRRGDLWRKLALLCVSALYWFHPLVHLMRRQAEWDIEMACDEGVLDGASAPRRREYGAAVLAVLEGGAGRPVPLSTRFAGGRRQMLRRFGQMVDVAPKRRGALPLALVLAAVSVCGAFVGCTAPGRTEDVEPPQAEAPQPPEGSESPALSPADEPDPGAEEAWAEQAFLTSVFLLEDMQQLFLDDLEQSRAMSAATQAEMEEIMRRARWSEADYEEGEMAWPLPGYYQIASEYGSRFGGVDFHTGMDLAGEGVYGASVVAAAGGEVRFAQTDYTPGVGYGIYLVLDHGGGVSTLYAQLSGITVEEGDRVEKGQKIAEVGSTGWSTGPHLHFEVRVDGVHADPRPYIIGGGGDEEQEPGPDQVGFVLPVDGSDPFRMDHVSDGGVWFGMERGGAVRASAAGTVLSVREDDGELGGSVTVDHGNGFTTLYANLRDVQVAPGDALDMAQAFAAPEQTEEGPYLYFAIYYNGQMRDAQNYIGTLQSRG